MPKYKALRILFVIITLVTFVMACYLYDKNDPFYAGILLAISAAGLLNIADIARQEREYLDRFKKESSLV